MSKNSILIEFIVTQILTLLIKSNHLYIVSNEYATFYLKQAVKQRIDGTCTHIFLYKLIRPNNQSFRLMLNVTQVTHSGFLIAFSKMLTLTLMFMIFRYSCYFILFFFLCNMNRFCFNTESGMQDM